MRKTIILRAIPGAGKSTYIKNRTKDLQPEQFAIASADNFFLDAKGKYNFDARKLDQAHKKSHRDFLDAVIASKEYVFVDNTNINIVDMAFYVDAAKAYDYEVEIVNLVVSPEVAAKRNIHGVPAASCKRMAHGFDHQVIPKYWNVSVTTIDNEK